MHMCVYTQTHVDTCTLSLLHFSTVITQPLCVTQTQACYLMASTPPSLWLLPPLDDAHKTSCVHMAL